MNGFSGNKDVDYQIMMDLDDKSLLNFCQTDKYVKSLCDNDNFWLRRTLARYSESVSKPYNKTWREQYMFLINHYTVKGYYDNNFITVSADRNFPTLDRYIKYAMEVYNENYYERFDLKSPEEIRDIIGYTAAEAVTFLGVNILSRFTNSIFDYGNVFGEKGEKNSILIPNPNKKIFIRWSLDGAQNAKYMHKYIDLTNGGYVTLDKGFPDPNYIFVPSLRVAGHPNDIRDYFIRLTYPADQIDPHISAAYNINNVKTLMKPTYDQELRELNEYKNRPQPVVIEIPTITPLPH